MSAKATMKERNSSRRLPDSKRTEMVNRTSPSCETRSRKREERTKRSKPEWQITKRDLMRFTTCVVKTCAPKCHQMCTKQKTTQIQRNLLTHTAKRKARTAVSVVSLWLIFLRLNDLVENAHEDKDTEVERELPFSFTQNKLATPMKNVSEERKTIESDADAEPCEPGLNSEEFMQFLKRRREERREVKSRTIHVSWCPYTPTHACFQECMNPPDYKYVDVVRHKKN